MSKFRRNTLINWSSFLLLYLLFSWWHGTFEGPLSSEEIQQYLEKFQDLYPAENAQTFRKFMEEDNGKAVVMVNAILLFDQPKPIDGKQAASSEEALETYAGFVLPFLIQRGSYPLYSGNALYQTVEVWGIEGAESWSSGALVRYRSLRTLMDMITREEFAQFHDHKVAAIEKTIAFPTTREIQIGGLGSLVFFMLLSLHLGIQLLLKHRQATDEKLLH